MAKGIAVKVFSELDMAAIAAAVGQMKGIWGKAGQEINSSLAREAGGLKALQNEMIDSANRAANAQINANKRAAEQMLADRRAAAAEAKKIDERTAADHRAILMAPIAGQRAAQSASEAEQASKRATDAADEHSAAMARNATAASAGAIALDRLGMVAAGSAAVGLGEALKQAVKFESQTAQMGAVLDLTTQQVGQMSNRLMELAPQVGRTLDELTKASTIISKIGFKDVAQNIQLTADASKLASIEGASLETTARALAFTMKDFNFNVGQSAEVASKMRAAVADSGTTVEEFMGSLHTLEPTLKTIAATADAPTRMQFFEQMNAQLAMLTKNGTSADQAAQNIRNTYQHLMVMNTNQSNLIGQLGGSGQQITSDFSQKGPAVAVQEVGDLIMNRMKQTPEGPRIFLDTLKKSADEAARLKQYYDGLDPATKRVADNVMRGNVNLKELREARQEGSDPGRFKQWLQTYSEMTGYDPLTKKFSGAMVPGTSMTIPQAFSVASGGITAFPLYAQTAGSPEARAQMAGVMGNQQNTHAEGNDPSGWARVSKTAAVSLKQMNAELQDIAVIVGTKILPEFKDFLHAVKGVLGYLGDHKVALDAIVRSVEVLGAAWAGTKILGAITTITRGLGTLAGAETIAATNAGTLASKEALIGNSAVTAASKVGVLISALGRVLIYAYAADQAIKTVNNATNQNTNVDPRQNPSGWWGTMLGPLGGPIGRLFGADPHSVGPAKSDGTISPSANPFNDEFFGRGAFAPMPGGAQLPPGTPDTFNPEDYGINPGDVQVPGSDVGGGKGKKTPSGMKDDPLYVNPIGGEGMGAGGGQFPNSTNMLSQMGGAKKGLWGKEGILGSLAGGLTYFATQLALGNPLGHMMAGEVSPYAWWYQGGSGKGMGKVEQSANRLANAFDRVQEAINRGEGPGTIGYDKAMRSYENAQISYGQTTAKYGGGGGFGGGQKAIANQIYQAAIARGYSPEDATHIVAYSIGESSLNPGISGGVQGDDEVIGLFQEKGGFARAGGIDPSQRGDAGANIQAYLNNLDKSSGPIDQRLLHTSVGGPMYTGGEAAMGPLVSQARGLIGPTTPDPSLVQGPVRVPMGGPSAGPGAPFAPMSGPGQSGPTAFGSGAGLFGGSGAPLSPFGKSPSGAGGGNNQYKDWYPNTGKPYGDAGGNVTRNATPNSTIGGFDTGASRGGFDISGLTGMIGGAASMGANIMAPGSGALVQLAMQEANRGAQALGEAAATMVGEFPLETFFLTGKDLSGKNVDMSKSFPGKIAGGLLGAHMNTPNGAGMGGANDPTKTQNPNDPTSTNPAQKNVDPNNKNGPDAGNNNNFGVQTGDIHMHNGEDSQSLTKNLNQLSMASPGGSTIGRS